MIYLKSSIRLKVQLLIMWSNEINEIDLITSTLTGLVLWEKFKYTQLAKFNYATNILCI